MMHPPAIKARTGRATVMLVEEDRKINTRVAMKPKRERMGSTIHERKGSGYRGYKNKYYIAPYQIVSELEELIKFEG